MVFKPNLYDMFLVVILFLCSIIFCYGSLILKVAFPETKLSASAKSEVGVNSCLFMTVAKTNFISLLTRFTRQKTQVKYF